MARLYELVGEYLSLMEAFESGEMSDTECGERLRAVDGDINHKILNMARMKKNIDSDLEGIKKERQRLQAREKTLQNQADGLKSYMKLCMEAVGTVRVKDEVLTVRIQNTGGRVKEVEEDAIPAEYWIAQPPTLDKQIILEKLRAGEEVPGCELEIGTTLIVS